MREASSEIDEFIEEYCIAVLNTQSEEEVEIIEQRLIVTLQDLGLSEDHIQNILSQIDEKLNEEMSVDKNFEVNTELGVENQISKQNVQDIGASFLGIGGAALIAVIALKKKNLKNRKEKNNFKK